MSPRQQLIFIEKVLNLFTGEQFNFTLQRVLQGILEGGSNPWSKFSENDRGPAVLIASGVRPDELFKDKLSGPLDKLKASTLKGDS